MSRRYTKADLEQVVYTQLENLTAIHDLLSIMKHQNELLEKANKKLKDEISDFKSKMYPIYFATKWQLISAQGLALGNRCVVNLAPCKGN